MSITASFDANARALTITGDALDNEAAVSRTAAGALLVNGGAVAIAGALPSVNNADLVVFNGLDGNDTLILSETLLQQRAELHGGAGDDHLFGGSAADRIFGDADNDTLEGNGGNDVLFGGTGNDTLIGGRGNDGVFGEDGNDRMVWNPGDGSDLFEGGNGTDFADVNGSDDAETFTATANGARVLFTGVTPAPFSLDIGTTEYLSLNMYGGDDVFSAAGNLGELVSLAVDGGAGNDIISGGNGNDILFGGDGNDLIHGGQGNDIAVLGAGRDVFIWNPGDGYDTVHGGDGYDALAFNGADIAENIALSANGLEAQLTRDAANVADIDGVEVVIVNPLGGSDQITVGNMTGTDVSEVSINLGVNGAGDRFADSIIVNATGGNDTIKISGSVTDYTVTGASTYLSVLASETQDHLTINGLGGDDFISAAAMSATATLTLDGGEGNDTIIGSAAADTIVGGNGADFLLGGDGNDIFKWDPGDGSDVVDGQEGYDAVVFNGANIDENMSLSANGSRALVTRDVANVAMDINHVDVVIINALGGADKITVGNMTGTDVSEVSINLGVNGVGDGAADSVVVDATNGNDIIHISGSGTGYTVTGASTYLSVLSSEAQDHLTVNALGGNDIISAEGMSATAAITIDGGDGNDTIIGSAAADTIIGGEGNDYLIGSGGDDTLISGSGLSTLQGGTGNDRYAVQSTQDSVVEFAGEGTDEVQTFLASYALRPNVENLVFVNGSFSHTGVGTSENNRFTGASGNDTFTGDGGADIFDYRLASNGKDTITDFDAANASAGHDHIDLSGKGLNFAALTLTAGADGTTVGIPGGDSILLKGVFAGIDAGDFFF